MARRDIIVSDFSGEEVGAEELVVVTVRFTDGRRGQIVADAAPGDEIIAQAGRKQKRRGRKSAATLEAELAAQAAAAGRRGRAKASA